MLNPRFAAILPLHDGRYRRVDPEVLVADDFAEQEHPNQRVERPLMRLDELLLSVESSSMELRRKAWRRSYCGVTMTFGADVAPEASDRA